MASRTFKKFTIQAGGTPQPLVGTWVSTSTVPQPPDASGGSVTSLPVNDSSMFKVGDWAYLIDAALTATKVERVLVQKVADATHVSVIGLTQTRTGGSFGTGDFVALAIAVNSFYCQCTKGNTGSIYVGKQGIVKASYTNVLAELLPFGASVQPIDFSDTRWGQCNATNSSEIWVDGTTADGYLPSFGVV